MYVRFERMKINLVQVSRIEDPEDLGILFPREFGDDEHGLWLFKAREDAIMSCADLEEIARACRIQNPENLHENPRKG